MAGKKEMSIQDLKEYVDEKFEELQEELTEVKAEIAEKRKKPKEETFEESLRKFKEGAISLAAFTYTIADEILRNVEKTAKESLTLCLLTASMNKKEKIWKKNTIT
ncbi:MAG: hypothetical protein QXQ02_05180, partial [Halobacteria archaeon]